MTICIVYIESRWQKICQIFFFLVQIQIIWAFSTCFFPFSSSQIDFFIFIHIFSAVELNDQHTVINTSINTLTNLLAVDFLITYKHDRYEDKQLNNQVSRQFRRIACFTVLQQWVVVSNLLTTVQYVFLACYCFRFKNPSCQIKTYIRRDDSNISFWFEVCLHCQISV